MQQFEFIDVCYRKDKKGIFTFEVTDGLTSYFIERSIDASYYKDAILVLLNEFGKEGWSLAAWPSHSYRLTLQRPIQPSV